MRIETWPEVLDNYLQMNSGRPYLYGEFDCVAFCADFVNTITGIDLLDGLDYQDGKTAAKVLKDGGGLFAMTGNQMVKAGYEQIRPAFAQRGDIVGFMTEKHGETVGICLGEKFVSPGENELIYLPMSEAVIAWEVK